MLTRFSTSLRERLRTGPGWQLTLWATLAAFATYFCMYAFRKPFAVGSWTWEGVWDLNTPADKGSDPQPQGSPSRQGPQPQEQARPNRKGGEAERK